MQQAHRYSVDWQSEFKGSAYPTRFRGLHISCQIMDGPLDVLFTKEEQGSSVLLITKKRSKPPLSPRRVQKLIGK